MNDSIRREIIGFLEKKGYDIPVGTEDDVAKRLNDRVQDLGLGNSHQAYQEAMDEFRDEILNPFGFLKEFTDD